MGAARKATATATVVALATRDRTVTEVWRGIVTTRTLSDPGIPADLLNTHRFASSPMLGHEADKRALLAATATRCAPWLRVFLGPECWLLADGYRDLTAFPIRAQDAKGRVWCKHSGVAFIDHDVVFCHVGHALNFSLSTLHHEIFHAVEGRLAVEDFRVIDCAAMARGASFPGEYLASPIERRARLYQNLASAWDEGVRPVMVAGIPVSHIDRVAWHIYTGGLARQVARGRVRPVVSPARAARRGWAFIRAYGLTLSPLATLAAMSVWARMH